MNYGLDMNGMTMFEENTNHGIINLLSVQFEGTAYNALDGL